LTLLLFARTVGGQYRSHVSARADDSGATGALKDVWQQYVGGLTHTADDGTADSMSAVALGEKLPSDEAHTGMLHGLAQATTDLEAEERQLQANNSTNSTEAPSPEDSNSNDVGDTQAPTPQPSNQGPTPAPTPDSGGKHPKVEAVNMKLKVHGVDYNKLKENATALEAFENATKAGLVAALDIDESDVLELLLSAGSVAVEAVIKPPEGVTASALKAKVSDDPEAFKTTVTTIITEVQGELEAAGVVTGELKVGEPIAEIVKVDPPDNGDDGNATDGDNEDDGKGAVGKALPRAAGTLLGALAVLAAAVHAA